MRKEKTFPRRHASIDEWSVILIKYTSMEANLSTIFRFRENKSLPDMVTVLSLSLFLLSIFSIEREREKRRSEEED